MRRSLVLGCVVAPLILGFLGWSWIAMAVAGGALYYHLADWSQTRQIAADPNRRERNPILGPKPSPTLVNWYFIGTALLLLAVAHAFESLRPFVVGIWLGVEFAVVDSNRAQGLIPDL